jgi:zinc protease
MIASMPLLRRVCAAVFLAALCCTAQAALPPGVTQGPSVEGITEYALGNGLKVLLFPDASQAKTTVNITYLVGSRMENYGETGMAHLLEHMLFKGTPSRTNIMSALGQRGIDFNGTTWLDRTSYFETFPRPTRTSTSRWQWKPTAWSTPLLHARTSTAR